MTIFVDPSGDDLGPGTIDQPFATVERARAAATPGSVVNLRAGTYRLTEPLRLSAGDSGVTFQAYESEEVVISGGQPVTGWDRGEGGVHTASVPGLWTRQLYVAGRRADRAAMTLAESLKRTETGYVAAEPLSWPGEVEFVYRGVYPWSEARCPASGVSGDTVTMAQPAFKRATELYRSTVTWMGPDEINGADNPTSVENSPAFVTEGTFALDNGVLYYKPLPGEELSDVVAPVLETLLYAQDVHDVVFRGITFADATWLQPSSPEGFLHYHGNGYYMGGEIMTISFGEGAGEVRVPTDAKSMPGNVVFENCGNVTLEGCRFTRLGGVALEFQGSGSGNTVRDCEITEVAGGGLVIGGAAERCRIENNRVHHIGFEYHGSPAILLSGTIDATVAHNEIHDVPHAGVVAYDGRGTQVLNNLVHNTMQVLADGGGIYIAGSQGTSHANGALIRGNVVRDTITPYNFALYTDYGAAWVTVQGNVIHRDDKPVVLEVSPPLEHVTFIGNYWDADPGDAPNGVTLADNVLLTEDGFAADSTVADIVAAAGPTPAPSSARPS